MLQADQYGSAAAACRLRLARRCKLLASRVLLAVFVRPLDIPARTASDRAVSYQFIHYSFNKHGDYDISLLICQRSIVYPASPRLYGTIDWMWHASSHPS
jgi:hypothetical protein